MSATIKCHHLAQLLSAITECHWSGVGNTRVCALIGNPRFVCGLDTSMVISMFEMSDEEQSKCTLYYRRDNIHRHTFRKAKPHKRSQAMLRAAESDVLRPFLNMESESDSGVEDCTVRHTFDSSKYDSPQTNSEDTSDSCDTLGEVRQAVMMDYNPVIPPSSDNFMSDFVENASYVLSDNKNHSTDTDTKHIPDSVPPPNDASEHMVQNIQTVSQSSSAGGNGEDPDRPYDRNKYPMDKNDNSDSSEKESNEETDDDKDDKDEKKQMGDKDEAMVDKGSDDKDATIVDDVLDEKDEHTVEENDKHNRIAEKSSSEQAME